MSISSTVGSAGIPRRFLRGAIGLAAILCLLLTQSARAAPDEEPIGPRAMPAPVSLGTDTPGVPDRPQLEAADLAAWLDGIVPAGLAQGDIAGATVAVVRDGKLLLARGYGYADVRSRIPVSAEKTLFRTGSVTKLFTWIAVMQLLEQGRLDLDVDVNAYLDVTIPDRSGGPVTLRHLMTHTGGFEERARNLLVHDADAIISLEQVIKDHIPARIYPAGEIPAYSNYGAALAGYIVQRVSGQPYIDYVENRILAPLGMTHSSFRQPLPPSLRDGLSYGYDTASREPLGFEYVSDTPAGAQSATATDMARFMLACLNGGALPGATDDARILKPATMRLMYGIANRPGRGINAMAHGFEEENRNGYRVLAHSGDLVAFHSALHIIPSANVGIYVSLNSYGANAAAYTLRTLLYEGFMDRYFPAAKPPDSPSLDTGTAAMHAAAIAGHYRSSRRFESSLFSFFSLLGQNSLGRADDGTVVFDALTDVNDVPLRFREVSPWLWREVGGQTQMTVKRTAEGKIEYVAADGWAPTVVFLPVRFGLDAAWIVPALVVSGAMLLFDLLAWPAGVALRRYARHERGADSRSAAWRRSGRRAATLACLAFLVSVIVLLLLASDQTYWVFSDGALWYLRLVQILGLFSVAAAVFTAGGALHDWIAADRGLAGRLSGTARAVACATVAYVVIAFNFLTLTLDF